jgi:(p)ppGpp synthase/HD superfamily hydrolase
MRTTKELYEACLAIAMKAHEGQTRHDGKTPYIKHPLELASMFESYEAKSVAILHDAIEDGKANGVDYDYLQAELFEFKEDLDTEVKYILDGCLHLTHWPEDGYMLYIKSMSPYYRKFKIMDITINLADSPKEHQKEKYKKAMKFLVDKLV